jgi:CheY-like chemotaxis protein
MSGRRVLAVDDEVDFAAFVADACRQLGCDVRACHSGAEARLVVPDFRPDLLVLDMVMPGEDGIEFLRWFAGQGYRARLVLVTGFNPRYAEMAGELGRLAGLDVAEVLSKPVRVKTLQDMLQTQLERVATSRE